MGLGNPVRTGEQKADRALTETYREIGRLEDRLNERIDAIAFPVAEETSPVTVPPVIVAAPTTTTNVLGSRTITIENRIVSVRTEPERGLSSYHYDEDGVRVNTGLAVRLAPVSGVEYYTGPVPSDVQDQIDAGDPPRDLTEREALDKDRASGLRVQTGVDLRISPPLEEGDRTFEILHKVPYVENALQINLAPISGIEYWPGADEIDPDDRSTYPGLRINQGRGTTLNEGTNQLWIDLQEKGGLAFSDIYHQLRVALEDDTISKGPNGGLLVTQPVPMLPSSTSGIYVLSASKISPKQSDPIDTYGWQDISGLIGAVLPAAPTGTAAHYLSALDQTISWETTASLQLIAGAGIRIFEGTISVSLPVPPLPSGGSGSVWVLATSDTLTAGNPTSSYGWSILNTTSGTTYTAGKGISISAADVISVNDGTGLQFSGNALEVIRPVASGGAAGNLLGWAADGTAWVDIDQAFLVEGIGIQFTDASGGKKQINVRRPVESGGDAGDVYTRTGTGYTWSSPDIDLALAAGKGITLTPDPGGQIISVKIAAVATSGLQFSGNSLEVARPVAQGGAAGNLLQWAADGTAWVDIGDAFLVEGIGIQFTDASAGKKQINVRRPVEIGGTDGQVYTRTSTGYTWADPDIDLSIAAGKGITLTPDPGGQIIAVNQGAGLQFNGNQLEVARPVASGGSANQILGWLADGTQWVAAPPTPPQYVFLGGVSSTNWPNNRIAVSLTRPVPSGGNPGQVLARRSLQANTYEWIDLDIDLAVEAGDGIDIATGNVISVDLAPSSGLQFVGDALAVLNPVPTTGTTGHYLQKTADGVQWAAAPTGGGGGTTYTAADNTITISGTTIRVKYNSAWGMNMSSLGLHVRAGVTMTFNDAGQLEVRRAVPSGGSTGQFMQRTASGYGWASVTGGGSGGTTYSFGAGLSVSGTSISVTRPLPSGGTTGDYLQVTTRGLTWAEGPTGGGGSGTTYSAGLGLNLSGTTFSIRVAAFSALATSVQGLTILVGNGLTITSRGLEVVNPLPTGGSSGQVLTLSGSRPIWANIPK